MTPEQRLTQIEKLLESAVKLSHSNTAKIDANSEAIDSLTEKIDSNSEAINALTERIDRIGEKTERNADAIDHLTNRVDRLTEQMGRATEMFIDSMGVIRTMQDNFDRMQSEIKGVQLENRRMMQRFFNDEDSDID